MEITFINVGYGDAILIQSNGFTMLLDGGSAMPGEFDGFAHRIRAADYLARAGISQIDLLVISHIHEDHVCGLEQVLERIPVAELRIPFDPLILGKMRTFSPDETAPRSAHLFSEALGAMSRIIAAADARGIPVSSMECGDALTIPGGWRLSALAPSFAERERFESLLREAYAADDPTEALVTMDRTSNDSSLLLKLEHGERAFLLTGDSCPNNWRHVDFSLLQNVNVLKLPHHGQRDSIAEEVMLRMPLTHVITTASSDRRYHSANPAVYDALLRQHPKVRLLFTDERSYTPYFENPPGAHAVKLVVDSEGIQTEFINIMQFHNGMEALT